VATQIAVANQASEYTACYVNGYGTAPSAGAGGHELVEPSYWPQGLERPKEVEAVPRAWIGTCGSGGAERSSTALTCRLCGRVYTSVCSLGDMGSYSSTPFSRLKLEAP